MAGKPEGHSKETLWLLMEEKGRDENDRSKGTVIASLGYFIPVLLNSLLPCSNRNNQ